jgi:hypothetical protein
MWPPKLLETVGPLVFSDSRKYYDAFVKQIMWPTWTNEASKLSSLIDFRDFAEDAWALYTKSFGLTLAPSLTFDLLIKALKATTDIAKRKTSTVNFLQENAFALREHLKTWPTAFVSFAIELELETFYSVASKVSRFRPVLKCSVDSIEQVIKQFETTQDLTLEHFQGFCRDLGLTTLWPILALWHSHERGDVEEVFLHAPLPRIFGATSCIRNAIERNCNPAKLAKNTRSPFQFDKSVIAGNGYLAFKSATEYEVHKAPRASLVANLPGISEGRYVWCLKPESLEAAIYCLEPFKLVLEFEVPKDETDSVPNWIDCQRDTEGALVLLWGHINSLTGNLNTQNVLALDEDALVSNRGLNIDFLQSISGLPNRHHVGQARIDWRDHGNLLSVHHTVNDEQQGLQRLWTHNYEIVFADYLLMTLSTDARPIESIYGSPFDVVLLSPLSSTQPLQHWTLEDAKYVLKASQQVPKHPSANWTSVCVAH